METRKNNKSNKELRVYSNPVELRETGDNSRTITGYACKFDKLSRSLGWFIEKIDREAFSEMDLSAQDVKALFNHDSNFILARSNQNSNTLQLEVDDIGLRFTFEAPNTTAGNDLLENIRLKNIQHCSFAFTVKADAWEAADEETKEDTRTILKFKELFDVSPVVDPAYLDTEVDVAERSYKEFKESLQNTPDKDQIKKEIEEREREDFHGLKSTTLAK